MTAACPACGAPATLSPHWLDSGLRSSFTFHVQGDFLLLVDDGQGELSVGDEAERVVAALAAALPGRRLLYRILCRDSGRWQELVEVGRSFVLRPVGARGTCADAIAAAEGANPAPARST